MPKKKAKKIKQSKTVKHVVVRSRAYGEHTRAARGSYKPAIVNAALAAKAKQVAVINAFASEIHKLLKQHAGFFKESMLWQKMLSRLHTVKVITVSRLLESLRGLEVNSRYTIQRFGIISNIYLNLQRNALTLQILNNFIPHLNTKANTYRYDIIVLFFNTKGRTIGDTAVSTKWFKTNAAASVAVFDIAIPKSSKFYMLLLRVHGGRNNEAINEMGSQGMAVVKVGEVGS